jgi:DNA-directed RNA polymerase I subunit RPA1
VVQFQYGEDGIDVLNASFLREFGFLCRNADRLLQQQLPASEGATFSQAAVALGDVEQQAAKACK